MQQSNGNNSEPELANLGLYLSSFAKLVLYAACALGSSQNFTNTQAHQRLCLYCLQMLTSHLPSPCDR